MSNYMKTSLGSAARVELHDTLSLTGAQISYNTLPKGESVPFIHSHRQNEEIYLIVDGFGKAIIDEEEISLEKGDCVRISPKANRQFFASKDNSISYFCIQVRENSLDGFTQDDAIIK